MIIRVGPLVQDVLMVAFPIRRLPPPVVEIGRIASGLRFGVASEKLLLQLRNEMPRFVPRHPHSSWCTL